MLMYFKTNSFQTHVISFVPILGGTTHVLCHPQLVITIPFGSGVLAIVDGLKVIKYK